MVVFQYHDEGTINVKKNGVHFRIFFAGWGKDNFRNGGRGEAEELIKNLKI